MVEVGNENSNKFWEYRIPEDDKICPESSRFVHVISLVAVKLICEYFDATM